MDKVTTRVDITTGVEVGITAHEIGITVEIKRIYYTYYRRVFILDKNTI